MSVCRRSVPVSSAVRRFIGAASGLALLSLAAQVRADEGESSVWLHHPNAVRVAGMGYLSRAAIAGAGPVDVLGGVTSSRQIFERLALEGTVGFGGGSQGNHTGPHLGVGARVLALKAATGALTAALGTHAALLDGFGPVAFVRAEVAWELRRRGGFNLIVGGGMAAPLNDSRRGGDCSLWTDEGDVCSNRFNAMSPGPWAHVEAGWSF